MTTVIVFIVALSILVFVHEWGHFIVAKCSGIRVDVFSIGFGPKILGFTWHGTEYRIAPIPFGGYVRIYGQEPMEEADGDLELAEKIEAHPDSFSSKSLWTKLAVVLAGPAMNIVLCFFFMPMVFMIGRLQPKILDEKPVVIDVIKDSPAEKAGLQKGDIILSLNKSETQNWKELITQISLHPESEVTVEFERQGKKDEKKVGLILNKESSQAVGYMGLEYFEFTKPIVGNVSKGSPAEKAGIKKGDVIKSIDGVPVNYWREITGKIQEAKEKAVNVVLLSEGVEKQVSMTAEFNKDNNVWLVGIAQEINKDDFIKRKHGFVDSVVLGAKESVKLLTLTFEILGRLFSGDLSLKSLGGPLQIAQATSSAAKSGFGEFIYLLAFLSMQLGVMNLLPIPVLDGGHIVFMTIEGVIRKKLSYKFRAASMQVGLVMLLGLMLLVTVNDVDSIWGFSNILKSIKSFF